MSENNDFYRKFSYSSKSGGSFGINILLPFISGVLATLLILGIAFGVPSIKQKIIGVPETSSTTSSSVPISNIGNLDQVSLSDFSNTAIGAANAVLPSIVGISVEYNITSSSLLNPSRNISWKC